MSGELIAAISMPLVWAGCLVAVVWFGVMKPARTAKGALQKLSGPLSLTMSTTSDSLWPATRDQFTWTSWPLIRGSRGSYRVEVTVQGGVRWHSTLTWVVVSGLQSVGGQVLVSRQPEAMLFSKEALNPFARFRAGPPPNAGDLESFVGSARVFYDASALERLLIEPVRAELLTLPGRWMNIGFDGPAMLIAWWGVETDPTIVERAFQIAMKSLQLLAERGATARGGLAPTGAHLGH